MTEKRRMRGSNAYAAGIATERRAEDLVLKAGYFILERRKRTPYGEIDLIAATATSLVFIEVKQRRDIADAAYAVSQLQQSRLFKAASYLLETNTGWAREETRFDAILEAGSGEILWLRDIIRSTS